MDKNNWIIKSLYFGKIVAPKGILTPGLDGDLIFDSPYIGFLLQNGKENVLVDTGIHQDLISGGTAWGGFPAEGGNDFVINALAKNGLKPQDIDSVIYTHLHNDHAGGLALFPDAKTYIQQLEYDNLMNQLPSQKQRGDYDPRALEDIKLINNLYLIDGDFVLPNGLELYLIPGHTLGSMAIGVPTKEGKFFILGDCPHLAQNLFPKMDKMQLLDGSYADITPAPDNYGPYILSNIVYNHWDQYKSFNKLKALAEEFDPKYYLCGHDPCIIIKGIWGK